MVDSSRDSSGVPAARPKRRRDSSAALPPDSVERLLVGEHPVELRPQPNIEVGSWPVSKLRLGAGCIGTRVPHFPFLGRQVGDLETPPGKLLDQGERVQETDPGTTTDVVQAPDGARGAHRSASGRDDIANVCEVASLPSVAEDHNRLTMDRCAREDGEGHVWSLPRAEHGEVAED